jgi:hypothetical protein
MAEGDPTDPVPVASRGKPCDITPGTNLSRDVRKLGGEALDKRLVVELIPGPAFLLGNALGGIFVGAGLAALATAVAVFMRWRWDQSLPWMALSIFGLTIVMLPAGLFLDDTVHVKPGNTIGSLAIAAIVVT